MPDRLRNSLLLRLGGMFAAITVLAVVSMSTSWIVAETTHGIGKAINGPIWLVEAASRSIALPPTIQRIAGSRPSRSVC